VVIQLDGAPKREGVSFLRRLSDGKVRFKVSLGFW
jgi:hypothetical protein